MISKKSYKRAVDLAGKLYYHLCKPSKYPVTHKIARQRMEAVIRSKEKI